MSVEVLCKNLLIGVSGSVHAISVLQLYKSIQGIILQNIKIILTKNAARVVDPKTLELFVDDGIFVDLWDRSPAVSQAPHRQLTRWADLFVVVPATANVLGKAANGIADDLLSPAILASPKPVLIPSISNRT